VTAKADITATAASVAVILPGARAPFLVSVTQIWAPYKSLKRADSGRSRPRIRDDVVRLDAVSAGPLSVRSFGLPREGTMPAERIAMSQVRDVFRLKTAGVGSNESA
jgi:hypothetical protein